MRPLRWSLVCLFAATSIALAQSPEPYIYYFSDILHAFVIERPDGSESRLIGQNVIPETHNAARGAGWSSSGRWLAFTTYYDSGFRGGAWESNLAKADGELNTNAKPPATQIPSLTGVMSADGSIFIPIEVSGGNRNDPFMLWSPTEDVLLIAEGGNPVRVRLLDPSRNQVLYESNLEGRRACYVTCALPLWDQDGSQLVLFLSRQDGYHVYRLSRTTFQLEEVLAVSTPNRVLSQDRGLLTFLEGDDLVVYDVFSHMERRYPAMPLDENDTIVTLWNTQHTQSFVEVWDYLPNQFCDRRLFWLSLDQPEIVTLQHNILERGCSSWRDVYWSPRGDKALIEGMTHPLIVAAPSLQQIMLPVEGEAWIWVDNDHLFGVRREPRTYSGFVIDVQSLQTRQLWLDSWYPDLDFVSPDGHYYRVGRDIYDLQTNQLVARSQASGYTFSPRSIWHENAGWVLLAQHAIYSTENIVYEAVQLHSTATRELTKCYGSLCADWLPAAVESFLAADAAPQSVIPAPIQSIIVESQVQRAAWNAEGTEIQVVSSLEDESTVTTWDAATGTLLEAHNIPFCERYDYVLDTDSLNDQWIEFERTPSFNRSRTFQWLFEPMTMVYALQDMQTGEILHISHLIDYRYPQSGGIGDRYSRWLGETLFFFAWGSSSRICNGWWHPTVGFSSSVGSPSLCKVSPTADLVLLIPMSPTDYTSLLDVVTGQRIPINFYAQDGAFSPDGTRLVLGSRTRVTIWNVEDIMMTVSSLSTP